MNDKPVIDFSTTVPAGGDVTITEKMDTDGFVTSLYARAHPGEETEVARKFRIWHGGKENGNPVSLIRFPEDSAPYLVGDNQTWDFNMRREFKEDDVIEVKYSSTADYDHPVSTVIAVEQERDLISTLTGGLL